MFQVFKLIYSCDKRGFILKLFYTTLTSVLPLINLYILKLLVDDVTEMGASGVLSNGLSQSILVSILLFCAITLLNRLISVASTVNNDILTQRLIDYINGIIQNKSIQLDLAYYDNPRYYDTFHRAQLEAALRPIRIVENFVDAFGSVISLVGVMALIIGSSWQVVVVMMLAVIPTFLVKLYKSRRIYKFRRETTQDMRRSIYYGQLLSDKMYAKEVRTFRLANFLRDKYVSIRKVLVDKLLRISYRLAFFDAATSLIEVVAMFFILVYLIKPVAAGAITIGSFVMLFEAFRRGQSYLNSLVRGVGGLYEHKLFINNLFEFLDLDASIKSEPEPKPFPDEVYMIEFEDVTFSYPDMTTPVLEHFYLKARKGEVWQDYHVETAHAPVRPTKRAY